MRNSSIAFFISYSQNINPFFKRRNVNNLYSGLQPFAYPNYPCSVDDLQVDRVFGTHDEQLVYGVWIKFKIHRTGQTQLHCLSSKPVYRSVRYI